MKDIVLWKTTFSSPPAGSPRASRYGGGRGGGRSELLWARSRGRHFDMNGLQTLPQVSKLKAAQAVAPYRISHELPVYEEEKKHVY